MHLTRFFVATILVFSLALVGTAGGDNAKKLVGLWEVTKSKDAPPGATVEFAADGKMTLRAKLNDQDVKVDGTYEVKDDAIVSKLTLGDQSKTESHKIKTLTDKQLVLEDEQGKIDEYKRLK